MACSLTRNRIRIIWISTTLIKKVALVGQSECAHSLLLTHALLYCILLIVILLKVHLCSEAKVPQWVAPCRVCLRGMEWWADPGFEFELGNLESSYHLRFIFCRLW